MKAENMETEILNYGSPPPCIHSLQQCRGCFGWTNMIRAACDNRIWRQFPLRCTCTGLVLKVNEKDPIAER
jgi:hypothetical protein